MYVINCQFSIIAMVVTRQCLALQFLKMGQHRYFSRKPDRMESFWTQIRIYRMPSETPRVILFAQTKSKFAGLCNYIRLLLYQINISFTNILKIPSTNNHDVYSYMICSYALHMTYYRTSCSRIKPSLYISF